MTTTLREQSVMPAAKLFRSGTEIAIYKVFLG
jgi:hypothetical protein